jgi:ferredoxin-thioredoxin reductase catalytic subunit
MTEPKQASLEKMWKYVRGFAEKSGTTMHPNPAVTEAVVKGLAMHVDELESRSVLAISTRTKSPGQAAPMDLRMRRDADL